MRDLVIFDWDGTLMDSTGRIIQCMQRAASDLTLAALPAERVRQIIGLGLPEAIANLYPELDSDGVMAMRDRYSVHFVEAEATPSELYPGARELLEHLRRERIPMAVATGKSRKGLTRVWQNSGLGSFFAGSRCADETRSKPAPDMVLELLAELRVSPAQAVVIGDTSFDLDMACAAGVPAIGVTWGAHCRNTLTACSPAGLCDNFGDILPLLETLFTETA